MKTKYPEDYIDKITCGDSKYMWLSALIDGEGCLGIRFDKQRTSKNPAVKIEISISNTNKEILEIAKNIAGGGSISNHSPRGNRKQSWVLRLPTGTVRELLPKLTLIVKKKQKIILLKTLSLIGITSVGGWKRRIKRSVLIEKTLKSLKNQIHELNFRGTKNDKK